MAVMPPGEKFRCPLCGNGLRPPIRREVDYTELTCPTCGVQLRARRRKDGRDSTRALPDRQSKGSADGFDLALRVLGLRVLAHSYRIGLLGGTLGLLALGGFVPVLSRWLRDELTSWDEIIRTLGGISVRTTSKDPDADFGPVIARSDAPGLFDEIEAICRRIGGRRPDQIRLTYLPACGVTAWRGSRALILGLPLLDVLSLGELRAILAHELAHLARGDVTGSAESVRFVEALSQALEGPLPGPWTPLRLWARASRRIGESLIAPVALGQETRADRIAALVAGGEVAANALVKVAMIQPLFREVLEYYDPDDPAHPNLYAFFRTFWSRLPEELLIAMRHRLLTEKQASPAGPHPPLIERLSSVQSYSRRAVAADDGIPAITLLGDEDSFERMLHNRLFGVPAVEPSLFHRAGS